jgi:DNA topoisomerase-1
MSDFGRALPRIRRQVVQDLSRRTLDRRRVIAGVVRLLDLAAVRVGNEQYATENKSFGLTTLRCRHATVLGETVRLEFNGKGGKRHSIEVCDRRVARTIRDCSELPGQVLFQYLREDRTRDRIRSQDVNEYLKEASGGTFTAKDFRTWTASVLAAGLLAAEPVPPSARAATRQENAAADQVAAHLGNTRSICKQCYISPAVFDAFRSGLLAEGWRRNRARWHKNGNAEESLLLWLLKQRHTELTKAA